jgi:predicted TIM-barrel fold metal-dependent hydrolase
VNDFSLVQKVDAHFHYYTEDSTISILVKPDKFYLIDVNYDLNENVEGNDSAVLKMESRSLIQKKRFPDQFGYLATFTLINWNSADWANKTIRKLQTSFDNGAIGVKLWKNIGMSYRDDEGKFIMIDNPRFDPVIKFIIEQDKAILAHVGEPKNCWLPMDKITTKGDAEYFSHNPGFYMFLHPDFPTYENQMNARDNLVKKFPKLRFVGAHLGSMEWSVDELAKRLDEFPNMAVDVSSRLAHLQSQSIIDYNKVRDFIIKYQDQLIYGSDEGFNSQENPAEFVKKLHVVWLEQWKYFVSDETMKSNQIHGEFKGLKLPRKVIDKIYRHNAVKWYKLKIQ